MNTTDDLRCAFIEIVNKGNFSQSIRDTALALEIGSSIARIRDAERRGLIFFWEIYENRVLGEAHINWYELQALGDTLEEYGEMQQSCLLFKNLPGLQKKFRDAGLGRWLTIEINNDKIRVYVERYFELLEQELRGGSFITEVEIERLEIFPQVFRVFLPEYLSGVLQFVTEKMEFEERHFAN